MAWIDHPGESLPHSAPFSEHTRILFHLPSRGFYLQSTRRCPLYSSHMSARTPRPTCTCTNKRGSGPTLRVNPGVCIRPQRGSPGQQSIHHHGTTALLYRASRQVLKPAGFPPAWVRSICGLALTSGGGGRTPIFY